MTPAASLVLVVLSAVACTHGNVAAEGPSAAANPGTISQAQPAAAQDAGRPSATETTAARSRPDNDVGQPPALRGVTRGMPPADAGPSPAESCTRHAVLDKLRAVTLSCRTPNSHVCGKVTVHPSADGGSVQTTFDLSGTEGVAAFSSCVTQKLGQIAWRCALEGDMTLDLGCDL